MSRIQYDQFNESLNRNFDNDELIILYHVIKKEISFEKNDLQIIKEQLTELINNYQENIIPFLGICAALNALINDDKEDGGFLNIYSIIRLFANKLFNTETDGYFIPAPNQENLWEGKQLEYRMKFMKWFLVQIENMQNLDF